LNNYLTQATDKESDIRTRKPTPTAAEICSKKSEGEAISNVKLHQATKRLAYVFPPGIHLRKKIGIQPPTKFLKDAHRRRGTNKARRNAPIRNTQRGKRQGTATPARHNDHRSGLGQGGGSTPHTWGGSGKKKGGKIVPQMTKKLGGTCLTTAAKGTGG